MRFWDCHASCATRDRLGRGAVVALVAGAFLALPGCGGDARQDENEVTGKFTTELVNIEFPRTQRLGSGVELRMTIRNADSKSIPNLAVTLNGLNARAERDELSSNSRPRWIVDQGPTGGTSALTDTWTMGQLEPGETKRISWHLTPVRAGRQKVHYRISAGLYGKALAVDANGDAIEGDLDTAILEEPDPAKLKLR